jgi:hypothetical protein
MQMAKEEPDLALMLDGIQVSNTGATVVVTIDQRGDLLRKLPHFKN